MNEAAEERPPREHLREMISHRDAAREQHAKLTEAREQLNLRALRDARDEAAAALRRAEEQAPRQLVDKLMGLAGPDEPDVGASRQVLTIAERAYADAAAAQALLDGELEETRLRVNLLDGRVHAALGETLQADPAVAALLRAHHEARASLLAIDRALQEVSRVNGLSPSQRHWEAGRPASDFPDRDELAGVWHAAIAALEADADAELPR